MELLEIIGTALVGALASGGSVAAYFRARSAEADAHRAETEADPKRSEALNRQILLLFTRVTSLEGKLEERDRRIDDLQEQVMALRLERDQLHASLEEARREALGLKAEVAQLRVQVEGVN